MEVPAPIYFGRNLTDGIQKIVPLLLEGECLLRSGSIDCDHRGPARARSCPLGLNGVAARKRFWVVNA